jgi:hypothetical protein
VRISKAKWILQISIFNPQKKYVYSNSRGGPAKLFYSWKGRASDIWNLQNVFILPYLVEGQSTFRTHHSRTY